MAVTLVCVGLWCLALQHVCLCVCQQDDSHVGLCWTVVSCPTTSLSVGWQSHWLVLDCGVLPYNMSVCQQDGSHVGLCWTVVSCPTTCLSVSWMAVTLVCVGLWCLALQQVCLSVSRMAVTLVCVGLWCLALQQVCLSVSRMAVMLVCVGLWCLALQQVCLSVGWQSRWFVLDCGVLPYNKSVCQ